jgi:hypothetical protein
MRRRNPASDFLQEGELDPQRVAVFDASAAAKRWIVKLERRDLVRDLPIVVGTVGHAMAAAIGPLAAWIKAGSPNSRGETSEGSRPWTIRRKMLVRGHGIASSLVEKARALDSMEERWWRFSSVRITPSDAAAARAHVRSSVSKLEESMQMAFEYGHLSGGLLQKAFSELGYALQELSLRETGDRLADEAYFFRSF